MPLKIVKQPRISEKEIFDFLRSRQGLLEGVVICGGEPTVNKELAQFIEKIKNLGYSVKLDTNGSNPEILKYLVRANLIDYVAMDIKSSLDNKIYKDILREGVELSDIKQSVDFLKNGLPAQAGKVDFEFRTTVVPTIHTKEDFLEIAKWIGGKNVKYYLQNFRAEKTIDPEFSAQGGPASGGEKSKPFPKEFLEEIVKEISPYFKDCQLRA